MGHILSFILNKPQKYRRVIFFEDEIMKLSSIIYTGENVLTIEDKTQSGCRVLLNRENLIQLQYLERSIIESIIRKEVYSIPLIHYQSEEFVTYLNEKCTQMESSPKNLDEMTTFIKNVQDDRGIKSFPNLSNQIQMCSTKQLAESVLNKVIHKYCWVRYYQRRRRRRCGN
ncbi:uncharacterized protein LOC111037815 [Myzus persicae]|uniref:uncharacterized protein LOC111037815 n=1 Tax=Myzus persicae TaxID=13164 RepID=UPI000B938FA1|nr:uncharacterized protein LOC111037815 [Myzus persicae]